jgi:CheY-like chemotaxis protein
MHRPWSILLTDDDEDSRELCAEYFAGRGFEVVQAHNGAEAFAIATSRTLDVIVMDLEMPVMGGVEAIRRLRSDARSRGIPVIVLSGNGAAGRRRAIRAGCDAYCSKPCDIEALAKSVTDALVETAPSSKTPGVA